MKTGLDLQAIEDEIRRCVGICKRHEIAVVPDALGFDYLHVHQNRQPDRVCLLGAVAWVHRARLLPLGEVYPFVQRILGLTTDERWAICDGFDGVASIDVETPLYQLGQQLRKEGGHAA